MENKSTGKNFLMRVALSSQPINVDYNGKRYVFRTDQILLSGALLDALTLAKNQSDVLFYMNPFILLNLSGIPCPYEENTLRFIEQSWPRARNMSELEREHHLTPGLDVLLSLRTWCKGGEACEAQWNTANRLHESLFASCMKHHMIALPSCLHSIVSIYRTCFKQAAYELFIQFFYARDICDDFTQTGFLVMTSAFLRNTLLEECKDDVLSFDTTTLPSKQPKRWRYYDATLQVYKALVSWVKKGTVTIQTGLFHKKRKGAKTMAEFFDDFAHESNLTTILNDTFKKEAFSYARKLWSQLLWRLVSQDTDPLSDPYHVIVLTGGE